MIGTEINLSEAQFDDLEPPQQQLALATGTAPHATRQTERYTDIPDIPDRHGITCDTVRVLHTYCIN